MGVPGFAESWGYTVSDQARMGSTVLSRRAAVRGAVWTLPAVTVATTAPAFASTSGGMALQDFSASYVGRDGLNVSGTVVAGAVAQAGTLTLRIEPRLITSVSSTPAAAVTGSFADGWTLVYPVTAGPFSASLDLGDDTSAGLFCGYRGDYTDLIVDAAPSAMPNPLPVPVVALGPKPQFGPIGASVAWLPAGALRVAATGVQLTADPAPAVGRLRVAMTVPTAVYNNPNPPTASNLAPGWQKDDSHTPYHWGGGWVLRFVTTQAAHTSLSGSAGDRGPSDFSVDLTHDATGFFEPGSLPIDFTSDETAFNWEEEGTKVEKRQIPLSLGPRPA